MIDQSPSPKAATVRALALGGTAVLALRAAEQDVLVVLGEADVASAELLYRQILRALPDSPRPVLVELGALTFCDCAGLDALRDVARAAEAAGVPLTFRGQSEQLEWLERTVPASGRGSRRTCSASDLPHSTTGAPC